MMYNIPDVIGGISNKKSIAFKLESADEVYPVEYILFGAFCCSASIKLFMPFVN